MADVDVTGIGSVITAIATIALVVLLYRTVKQLEATVEVSRIQTEYRFRPWIGHSGDIKKMETTTNGDCQFDITIKNFGELPASGVSAKFGFSNQTMTRNDIQSKSDSFDLGPILPNMEKHFWFFIPKDVWKNTIDEKSKIFTGLFFEYAASGQKNGYGMLSEYNPTNDVFVHKDMWLDDTKL